MSTSKRLGALESPGGNQLRWSPSELAWRHALAKVLRCDPRKLPAHPEIDNNALSLVDRRAPAYILRGHLEALRVALEDHYACVAAKMIPLIQETRTYALPHHMMADHILYQVKLQREQYQVSGAIKEKLAYALQPPYGSGQRDFPGAVPNSPGAHPWHRLPTFIANAVHLTLAQRLHAIALALGLYSPLRDRQTALPDHHEVCRDMTAHPLYRIV